MLNFLSKPKVKESKETAEFEKHLENELLRSEDLRSNILIFLFLTGGISAIMFVLFMPEIYEKVFQGKVPASIIIGIFFILAVYEWVAKKMLQKSIKKGGKWSTFMRFGHAFEETSIPTIVIVLMATVEDPLHALLSPPSYAYFIFIALSALRLDYKLSVFTGGVAGIEYAILSWFCIQFSQSPLLETAPLLSSYPPHLDKVFLLCFTGIITGIVTYEIKRRIRNSFRNIEERNKVVNMFGQHVSPVVVNKLLEQKTGFDSETKHVCIMFLDIRQFTKFSEQHSPEHVVAYLNTLFDYMIQIVNQNHGIINKFLGDGFMAIFGAPIAEGNYSWNAVKAGLEIVSKTEELVRKGEILPTRIGIGIHAGEAITGNIGSSLRKEYTVIGDTVNLASRVEQLNKQFNSQFLITEEVNQSIKDQLDIGTPLGPVHVKGREEQVQIYRLA